MSFAPKGSGVQVDWNTITNLPPIKEFVQVELPGGYRAPTAASDNGAVGGD
jgi:hypothetical protein